MLAETVINFAETSKNQVCGAGNGGEIMLEAEMDNEPLIPGMAGKTRKATTPGMGIQRRK